jgi:hypothetical protein
MVCGGVEEGQALAVDLWAAGHGRVALNMGLGGPRLLGGSAAGLR